MKDERLEVAYVLEGVTTDWLAAVFKRAPATVKNMLVGCPIMSIRQRTKRYELATAAEYLVEPKLKLENYIKRLNKSDLPANLQAPFWDARLKRQKWETKAGMLWPTERVVSTFTEVFKTIRNTMGTWVDDLERMNMTEAQRIAITAKVDELQANIYKMLIADAELRTTRSQLADLDEIDGPDEDEEDGADDREKVEDYI